MAEQVTKKTLAEGIAAEYEVSKKDANELVKELVCDIVYIEVSINGFGKFVVVEKAAREGLNPATGEKIKIKASKAPKFKASKTLKDLVNSK